MLKRRTPLRNRTPIKRSGRIRARRLEPRDRGELADPPYIAWLWTRPCRVPGCNHPSEPHHLRHDENGAALGARVKDDRRAISLCHWHHFERLHSTPWLLRAELGVDDLKAWQDAQLAEQRTEYLRLEGQPNYEAMAF